MKVKVRYLGVLRTRLKTGEETIELEKDGPTALDLVDEVIRRHGEQLRYDFLAEDNSLLPRMMIHVNGELIRGAEVRSKILEGKPDIEMLILPSIAGG